MGGESIPGDAEALKPIEYWKARERDDPALLALQDPSQVRLFAVWGRAYCRPNLQPSREPALDEWDALWKRYTVDLDHLASMLGPEFNIISAEAVLRRAKDLGVIYPDGTLHAVIETLMRSQAEIWRRRIMGDKAVEADKVAREVSEDDESAKE